MTCWVCWLQKTFSFPAYLKCFDAQAASNYINPYAVDVIRAKRRDLIYYYSTGSSRCRGDHDSSKEIHHFDRQDSHRSKLQGPGHREGQRGKGMPEILPSMSYAGKNWPLTANQGVYVGGVNKHIWDARRQLTGYSLERDQEGIDKNYC